jgi:hypothetical protein
VGSQKLLHDLIATKGERTLKLQCKRDKKVRTDGPFIELGRVWHRERDASWKKVWQEGWSVKVMHSNPDDLSAVVYVDFERKKLYMMYPQDFATVVQKYVAEVRDKIPMRIVASNKAFTTFGFRVPFDRFKDIIKELDAAQDFEAVKAQAKPPTADRG